jgi:hypothetical protein
MALFIVTEEGRHVNVSMATDLDVLQNGNGAWELIAYPYGVVITGTKAVCEARRAKIIKDVLKA